MRRVILESPFAGSGNNPLTRWWNRLLNRRYARKALLHSLSIGESPLASHLLYTQVLDDRNPTERTWGINAGLSWGDHADATVVYIDRGISRGMHLGISRAKADGRPVEYRRLEHISAGLAMPY